MTKPLTPGQTEWLNQASLDLARKVARKHGIGFTCQGEKFLFVFRRADGQLESIEVPEERAAYLAFQLTYFTKRTDKDTRKK